MHRSNSRTAPFLTILLSFSLPTSAHLKHKALDPYYAPQPLFHFLESHQGLAFSCCTRRLYDEILDFTDLLSWTASALTAPIILMKSRSNLDGACLSFMQTGPSVLPTEEGVDFHYNGVAAPLFFGNTEGLITASRVDDATVGVHNAFLGTSYTEARFSPGYKYMTLQSHLVPLRRSTIYEAKLWARKRVDEGVCHGGVFGMPSYAVKGKNEKKLEMADPLGRAGMKLTAQYQSASFTFNSTELTSMNLTFAFSCDYSFKANELWIGDMSLVALER